MNSDVYLSCCCEMLRTIAELVHRTDSEISRTGLIGVSVGATPYYDNFTYDLRYYVDLWAAVLQRIGGEALHAHIDSQCTC